MVTFINTFSGQQTRGIEHKRTRNSGFLYSETSKWGWVGWKRVEWRFQDFGKVLDTSSFEKLGRPI